MENEKIQCSATTLKGDRCKKNAIENSKFCAIHNKKGGVAKKPSTKKESTKKVSAKKRTKKRSSSKKPAKKVGAKKVSPKKKTPTKDDIKPTLMKLKVEQLKIMLERRNLPKTGKKEELIKRLMDYAAEDSPSPKASPKRTSPKKVSPKKVSPKKVSPKKVSPKRTTFAEMEFSDELSGEDSNDELLYPSPGSKTPSFGSSDDWEGDKEDYSLAWEDYQLGLPKKDLIKLAMVNNDSRVTENQLKKLSKEQILDYMRYGIRALPKDI